MATVERIIQFIAKYVTLWVILIAVLAYVMPEPFMPYGGCIPVCLGIIMLGMGLSDWSLPGRKTLLSVYLLYMYVCPS